MAALHFPELDRRPVNVTNLSSGTLFELQSDLGRAAIIVEKEGKTELQKQLV